MPGPDHPPSVEESLSNIADSFDAVVDLAEAFVEGLNKPLAMGEEVKRLRALIKSQEIGGTRGTCPWCEAGVGDGRQHIASCPAFTPTGEVK